jgi:DNA recombination protein RmuC
MDTIILIAIITAFLLLLFFIYHLNQIKNNYRKQWQTAQIEIEEHKQNLLVKSQKLQILNEQNEQLRMDLAVSRQKLTSLEFRIDELKNDEQRLNEKFENLANRVIQTQSTQFIKQQTKGMHDILRPLKEKIVAFEQKVENSNVESAKRHQSLKEQIKFLSEKSQKVSEDADKLAKALKGDYKKQGNWGEMILESILQKSGLEKGREYETQISERNEEGKLLRPDVVIKLPDKKVIVVDSKVSLSAYSSLVNASEKAKADQLRQAHCQAVKNHIEGLSAKSYHELYQLKSPDFVLMFIPIDTAFTAALESDPELYNYAFERNIVIVSASTLLATLKTVETMWRNDRQNRYALKIAAEAGKMYDKFVGFLGDLQKMGQQLQTVQNTYNDSMRKLSTGTGNLVGRAEKLKSLGAKTKKLMPQDITV